MATHFARGAGRTRRSDSECMVMTTQTTTSAAAARRTDAPRIVTELPGPAPVR